MTFVLPWNARGLCIQPQGKAEMTSRISFALIISSLLGLYFYIPGPENELETSIHLAIIAISLVHVIWLRRFNLALSFSLFMMFFFGFIPLFEYKLGITYNGTAAPSDTSYVIAATLALLSCLSFHVGYGLRRDRLVTFPEVGLEGKRWEFDPNFAVIVAGFGMCAIALSIGGYYQFSPSGLMFRGYAEEVDSSAFGYSAVNYFLRPLLFNLVFLVLLLRKSRSGGRTLKYLLFAGLLIFVSPIGIPRSLAGALYLPLFTMIFMPRLNSKYGIFCLVVLAVLFVAPVFDIFRIFQLGSQLDLGANFNLDYLFAGHFDAFYNFVQVIETRYVSGGLQIIGALLFWVPRDIWPHKPMGTSFDFGAFAGYRETNVSFPLPADFYVDYGVVGVILGMCLLGLIYRRLDRYFCEPRRPGSTTGMIGSIAQQELSILGLYLLRGNFLSSFSFTMGVASSFVILWAAVAVLKWLSSPDRSCAELRHE